MTTSSRAGIVTLTVATEGVERKVDRDGTEFYLARLPEGTVLDGRDLSVALVCSANARESMGRSGLTDMELRADEPKVVKVPSKEEGAARYERVEVDPAALCEAASDALMRTREVAMAEQALALLRSGQRDVARDVLSALLKSGGNEGPLPPSASHTERRTQEPLAARCDPVRAYEAVGILPAYQPLCSVNTHGPAELVPERFSHVAFDEGHCVSREFFNQLLERARARVPQHAGALEEHSIGYVARQLREPFARTRDRCVAQVNGIGVDFTDEVRAIPGASVVRHPGADATREVMDLGVAALAVDRMALMERHGMDLTEADAVTDWVQRRVGADLEVACDRMGMASASALLRSPDAVQLLVEAGVRLENPTTGERMEADLASGRVTCDFDRQGRLGDGDESSLMSWYCVQVASDDGWRINPDDARALANAKEGSLANLRERARTAYLADPWLTARDRIETIPTRQRAEGLLAHRGPTNSVARGYSLKDECKGSQATAAGAKRPKEIGTRVA